MDGNRLGTGTVPGSPVNTGESLADSESPLRKNSHTAGGEETRDDTDDDDDDDEGWRC